MESLLHGEALVVEERLGAFCGGCGHAFIPALGADMGGAAGQASLVENRCQGHAGPLAAGKDHALLSAGRARTLALEVFEICGVAAGALHDSTHRTGRETANIVVVEAKGLFDLSVHGQRPVANSHRVGNAEMLHHVVQLGGRDQTLQIHDRRADALGFAVGTRKGNGFNLLVGPAVPGVGLVGVIRRLGAVHLQKVRPRGVAGLILRGVLLRSHSVCVSKVGWPTHGCGDVSVSHAGGAPTSAGRIIMRRLLAARRILIVRASDTWRGRAIQHGQCPARPSCCIHQSVRFPLAGVRAI